MIQAVQDLKDNVLEQRRWNLVSVIVERRSEAEVFEMRHGGSNSIKGRSSQHQRRQIQRRQIDEGARTKEETKEVV